MTSRPPGEAAGAAVTNEADERDAFAELQALLVGRERDQVASILARLDNPEERRREVADVLPNVLVQQAGDPRFMRALTPPVERAITASVRRNPAPLADALFPVMGPAIRKAVAAALSSMVEGLNRTLEHSLSWRSLAWRVEALRTGRTFGEVALLHTLVYRVEQLFLIDRTSGLLLLHIARGADGVRDADMVSGMLTAIRSFVQDSFTVRAEEDLGKLEVGGLVVWIEQGPRAVLAAVVRGTAPPAFRATLQNALERIHLEFADAFEQFSGDTNVFEGARPTLEDCLHSEFKAEAARGHRVLWLVTAAVLIALAAWAAFAWRARARWDRYLQALNSEPGIVVVSSGRRGGKYAVSGLRDPLARDPASLLAPSALTASDVDARWELYHAAVPSLAAARARQVLQPPAGVSLTLNDGVLSATGAAPIAWLVDASRLAPLISGVSRFDASGALNASVRDAVARLESLSPLFVKGRAELVPGQESVLQQLVARTAELERAAATLGLNFRVTVIGHTDADGAPDANIPLSRLRAAVVRGALEPVAGSRLRLEDEGVGSDEASPRLESETDKQRDRRVTVRVATTSNATPSSAGPR